MSELEFDERKAEQDLNEILQLFHPGDEALRNMRERHSIASCVRILELAHAFQVDMLSKGWTSKTTKH